MKNYEEVLSMNPVKLITWLEDEFKVELPTTLDNSKQMEEVLSLLPKTINTYSYLMSISSYAKLAVRERKRTSDKLAKMAKVNKDKELQAEFDLQAKNAKMEYEDMIDRKEAIDNYADISHKKYNAISRMITVKKEINAELKMLNLQ